MILSGMSDRLSGGLTMKDPTIGDLLGGIGTALVAGLAMLLALVLPFLLLLGFMQHAAK
jgi:hypothetical protein